MPLVFRKILSAWMTSAFSRAIMGLLSLTVFTGLLNFGSNIIAARVLGPIQYADYVTFAALLSLLLIPNATMTTKAAQATGLPRSHPSGLHGLRHIAVLGGNVQALVGASVMFMIYQHEYAILPTHWWIPVFTGGMLWFAPLEAFYVGVLQGQKKFIASQLGRSLNAICKVIGIAGLWIWGGNLNDALAIALASQACTLLYVLGIVRNSPRIQELFSRLGVHVSLRRLLRPADWASAFVVTLSSIIFFNLDMIIARSVLSPHAAGLFAALGTSGKVLALTTGPISYVLYPHLLTTADPIRRRRLILTSWVGTGGIGLSIVVCLAVMAHPLVHLLFGAAYEAVAPVLVFYGLAFAFFSLANIAFTVLLSVNAKILWIDVLGGGLLELIALLSFHKNVMMFTIALATCMGLLWVVSSVHALREVARR